MDSQHRQKNLPINTSTRICSAHFVKSKGRMLRSDEVPTLNLPILATRVSKPPPRRPINHVTPPEPIDTNLELPESHGIGVNTELTIADVDKLEEEVTELKEKLLLHEDKDEGVNSKYYRIEKIKSRSEILYWLFFICGNDDMLQLFR